MTRSLALLFFLAACGNSSTKPTPPASAETGEAADFRMICDEATRASSQPGSADDRQSRLAATVIEKLHTDGARKVVKFAGSEPANKKLAILKQGAAELNVTGWDCPAIAAVYGPQDPSIE